MSKKEKLQEGLNELEEKLNDAIEAAEILLSISKEYRCFGGQLDGYLIGHLKNFINNGYQPGSIASLQAMLDKDEEGYDEDEEEEE
jgi:hypothetical protein